MLPLIVGQIAPPAPEDAEELTDPDPDPDHTPPSSDHDDIDATDAETIIDDIKDADDDAIPVANADAPPADYVEDDGVAPVVKDAK